MREANDNAAGYDGFKLDLINNRTIQTIYEVAETAKLLFNAHKDYLNENALIKTVQYLTEQTYEEYYRLAASILLIALLYICIRVIKRKPTEAVKEQECISAPSTPYSLPFPYHWNVFDLAKTAYEPGHSEACVSLIERLHYDVNSVIPSTGLTLFLCACLSGEKKLIKFMLKRGADIKRTTNGGDSALYLATFGVLSSSQPDISVLEEIIYAGADPCRPSASGIYPIDSATNAGHLDAARLLEIYLPNPHVWDIVDHHTPPHISFGLQSPERKHLIESTRRIMSPKML
ncbi:uncharacterized protein LOC127856553 isoform X2 [Dreissena polymorpha]|uniref:uncharacterized protein LOC127856553 isoform X2 n=1 Tax=Dreissena polymorpha TaxID=45954 RepID=UPI0022650EBB|nr:uncharacterized protein LOC127856553 isoform X2 [Dreissena polymorpha]